MWPNLQETVDLVTFTEEILFFLWRDGVIVTLYYFKRTIYCNIYQYLDKRFTLRFISGSINHENKQAMLGKDKSRNNFKAIYINVFKTLENSRNNPNNGINGSY